MESEPSGEKNGAVKPEEAPKVEVAPDVDVEMDEGEAPEFEVGEDLVEEVPTRPSPPIPAAPTLVFRHRFTPLSPPETDFPIASPLLDPNREAKDVATELDQRRYETSPLYIMRNSIRTLRDSRMSNLANLRRRQSVIFLNLILYPFIDGLADELQVSPDEQVRTMVRGTQTIGSLIARNRDAAHSIFNQPQVRIWSGLARPALEATEEEIRSQDNIDWWMDVVKKTRHEFWQVLEREPNGRWWLAESLVETLNFLKGILTQ